MTPLDDEDRQTLKAIRAERDIRAALLRFCRGADRKDYDLLRTAFHEDAYDDHGAYSGDVEGFIAWQKTRHENIPQCMHFVGNCTIDLSDDIALTETYCIAVIHTVHEEGGFSRTSLACRYLDRFENRGPGWRIARRNVIYDWAKAERVDSLLPAGLPQAKRDFDDLVYLMSAQQPQSAA